MMQAEDHRSETELRQVPRSRGKKPSGSLNFPRKLAAVKAWHEALNLIGSALYYGIRGKDVYDTLLRCSEDGEHIFSLKFNGSEGKFLNVEAGWLDALPLLSLGFGKAL